MLPVTQLGIDDFIDLERVRFEAKLGFVVSLLNNLEKWKLIPS